MTFIERFTETLKCGLEARACLLINIKCTRDRTLFAIRRTTPTPWQLVVGGPTRELACGDDERARAYAGVALRAVDEALARTLDERPCTVSVALPTFASYESLYRREEILCDVDPHRS